MITGRGNYIDDIALPGMLYAAIVRSPEAHAAITSIDTAEAAAAPGVVAVFTGEDLAGEFAGPLPMAWDPPGVEINTPEHWPLSRGEVKHVGDPVAVVVATTTGEAVDAADMVLVDYDPKPAVVDPEKALEDGSPLVWEQFGTNKTHEWAIGGGDIDAALAEAEVTVEQRVANHRTSGAPIEPRGSIGGAASGEPHPVLLDADPAHRTPAAVRDARDTRGQAAGGGAGCRRGFGAKLQLYGEEALVLVLAKRIGRPVKWVETRSEHMTTSHHGRDQVAHVTLGSQARRDAHRPEGADIRGPRRVPAAAHAVHSGAGVPRDGRLLPDPVDRPPLHGRLHQQDGDRRHPRRGPPGGHLLDGAHHGQARPRARHGPARAAAEELHPQGGVPVRDRRSGSSTTRATTTARSTSCSSNFDLDGFRAEQAELREKGIHRGVGFSTWTEVCGLAPSRAVGPQGVGLQAAFWESAMVRVHPSGSATVYTGTSPHGQGLDTSFAQIAADRLGIDPENVNVRTATPTRARGDGARTARARSPSAARPSRAPRRRCRRRPRRCAPRCWRPRPRTSRSRTAPSE